MKHIFAPLLIIAAFATTIHADDAAKLVDSIYGQRIKQAKASLSRDDDVALAQEMMAAAEKRPDQPSLAGALCDLAADLTEKHASGLEVAARALEMWGTLEAERWSEIRERLLDVLVRQMRSTDVVVRENATTRVRELLMSITDEHLDAKQYSEAVKTARRAVTIGNSPSPDAKARLEFALMRETASLRVSQLQARLLENSDDRVAAKELVRLHVVELDDPTTAKKYTEQSGDAELARLVELAAQPVGKLVEVEAKESGLWYAGLADEAKPAAKGTMLKHAISRMDRFLALHSAQDLERNGVELRRSNAAAAFAATNPESNQGATKSAIPTKGLLIHYEFEEGQISEKTIRNLASDRWHGTVAGGKPIVSEVGAGIAFHGRGQFLDTGFKESLDQWTFAAWIEGDEEPSRTPVFSTGPIHRDSAFQLVWNHKDQEFVGVVSTEVKGEWIKVSIGKVTAKKWNHFAATYDGNVLRVFVNGQQVGNAKSKGGSHADCSSTLKLGCHARATNNTWSGAIAVFVLYDRPLTAREISQLADSKR